MIKTSRVGGLIDDDYNLVAYQMEEYSNETCKKIDDCNTNLVGGITDLLKTLCVVVKEVSAVVM